MPRHDRSNQSSRPPAFLLFTMTHRSCVFSARFSLPSFSRSSSLATPPPPTILAIFLTVPLSFLLFLLAYRSRLRLYTERTNERASTSPLVGIHRKESEENENGRASNRTKARGGFERTAQGICAVHRRRLYRLRATKRRAVNVAST